ncbi:MAG TPA: M48 family metalloprotease [Alphaproteobacteria bacterium]|nr:M48 family metalloprotease [Alphaproteobacteria bacterium]
MLRRFTASVAIASLILGLAANAYGQSESGGGAEIARIRDAEIESDLRSWGAPVWQAAGLDPQQVQIVIVNDRQINAFVAGGLNIFLYAGLLIQSDSANQVVGVMAHETGHIAGGHLARMGDAIENAEIIQILGMLVGAAVIAASGGRAGEAGMAGMSAGTDLAVRNFLSFSRTQERSADQAGVNFLEQSGQSARGLLEFMQKLQTQEFLSGAHQDPYLRTHPLTQDRIDFIANFLKASKYANAPPRPGYVEEHARMRGKLIGFLWPISRVFERYKEGDNSVESRYARAVAYHRESRDDQALKLVDGLIAEHPDDAFYNELKGQFLFEAGKVKEALGPYEKANKEFPHNALLESELAQAMVETGDSRYNDEALANLNEAVTLESDDPLTWRMLAIVYGRQGKDGQTALALAEEFYAEGRYKDARAQAKRAQQLLPYGSPGGIRAQDIEQAAAKAIKDAKG